MATDLRVYDNEHGDPVVVMVTTGTHDVSRLVGLMQQGRCEDHDQAKAILRGVRRHNGGRAALKVLAAHGGPDLLTSASAEPGTLAEKLAHIRKCSKLAGYLESDLLRLLDGYDELVEEHTPADDGSSFCEGDGFSWPCRTNRAITRALTGGDATS